LIAGVTSCTRDTARNTREELIQMEVRVIPVTKAHLDKIPDMERAFYLHVGHLRNEITILYKLLT
jgi:hypothetical protein